MQISTEQASGANPSVATARQALATAISSGRWNEQCEEAARQYVRSAIAEAMPKNEIESELCRLGISRQDAKLLAKYATQPPGAESAELAERPLHWLLRARVFIAPLPGVAHFIILTILLKDGRKRAARESWEWMGRGLLFYVTFFLVSLLPQLLSGREVVASVQVFAVLMGIAAAFFVAFKLPGIVARNRESA